MDKKIDWWKKALIYQIYPLSFNDSNGDGIGDINGITLKLDYLKNLGVDVIWLSPIYESPMDDNGYDISDYYKINPIFGTFGDFNNLLKEVHQRDMKLIMDLVINHTSDEHVWFKEALKDKTSKYRNYYIFSKETNDIQSVFSGSAWEYDKNSDEYYFHLFSKKQPDLNWENKELRAEIYQMINFWLDLGIDGFRLDVIDLIGKDIKTKRLADGPYLDLRLKELYETCFKGRDIMTVGETPGISIKRARELSSYPNNYLDMVFQFTHISLDEQNGKGKWFLKDLDLVELKKTFLSIQNEFEGDGWTSLFWSNHDQPRLVSRYGNDRKYLLESSKMLFTILYLLKGTPFVYQGEELGMTKANFTDIYDYKDLESINMYHDFLNKGFSKEFILNSLSVKSRDNSRTPMQWNKSLYAGFSTKEPWIKVNDNYKIINAEENINNKDSIYNYVKQLFKYRKDEDVFINGKTEFINIEDKDTFIYKRFIDLKEVIVVGNFKDLKVNLNFDIDLSKYKIVLNNYKDFNNYLKPYQVLVLERI